ncbi:MAG TPA: bifunctional DNA-formamidopyrimidine glycosylase/DNA-(apurinic or apyrimidinic site) lyase [Terriglobia bacterium]
MPELPEVETVRRGLEARVLGHRITAAEVGHAQVIDGPADAFEQDVRGVIRRLDRKGKAIAIELTAAARPARAGNDADSPHYLLVRLGMTGQVTVVPRDGPVEPHTHVRLTLENGEEIRYRDIRRFGRLRYCTAAELEGVFSRLGPDAPSVKPQEFLAALKGRRTPVKNWLLNQGRLAGVGNIYADESLFAARIHPLTEAGRLKRPEALALRRAVEGVLRRAVALQGTSLRDYIDIDGNPGRFATRLKVYQRTGEPCRRCGTKIRRVVIGGRSSHFCPHCQRRK